MRVSDHDGKIGRAPVWVEVVPLMHGVIFGKIRKGRTGLFHDGQRHQLAQGDQCVKRFRGPACPLRHHDRIACFCNQLRHPHDVFLRAHELGRGRHRAPLFGLGPAGYHRFVRIDR